MFHVITISVFLLILPAQQPAMIHGVVSDATGAVIPAATVALSGANFQRTGLTQDDGSYSFPGLTAGNYTLKVSYPGFEAFEQRVKADSGRTLLIGVRLVPETLTQSLTVTEDHGPELSLESDANAGTRVVKDSDLDALPDNPDDLRDMLQTLTGPTAGGFGGSQILVDGFGGGQLPPKSAIKEIKINPNRYSADRDGWWGNIEIVTKPGADKFHGSIGLTDSDAAFNSRNPYAANKADYLNRMLTANAGGSLKARASYNFSFYRSTINNTALIDAVTLDPTTLVETPVRSTVVVPRDDISGMGRLDYQISTNHSFTSSYQRVRIHRDNNGVGRFSLESRGYSSQNVSNQLRLTETAVLSSNVVTETRFAYTRNRSYQHGDTSTPSLIVSAAFNGGSSQTGEASNANTLFELQSNTTAIRNVHTFRFGGRLRHNAITDIAPSNFGGTFSFFGVTNAPVLDGNNQPVGNETAQISSLEQYRRTLLFRSLGYAADRIRTLGGGASQFSIAAGNPLVSFSQTDIGVYFNDDWRARPDLTVSIGLRYEAQTNIHDWTNFGPRLAFAWSPGNKTGVSPKTVFRVGSGMFYYRVDPALTQQTLRFDGTTEQQYLVLDPDFYPTPPPLTSLAPGHALTTYRMDPNIRALPMFMTSATVERQLPGNTSLSVTYLDQLTTHMPQTLNINAPLPGTYVIAQKNGIRPFGDAAGNIFQLESGGVQDVRWLEVHLNNRLGRKLSFSAQYYRVNAYNNGGWDNATPSNPYNVDADWARVAWTGTHEFSMLGTLTVPGGIQFSPLFLARSGRPYDLTIGSDLNGDTVANDRPAFATDLSRPSVVITKFGAFDTDPLPGQRLVPRNYLNAAPMWSVNLRVGKSFSLGGKKEVPASGSSAPAHRRYGVNFNIDVDNLFNHLNPGGFVGNLASPLFGQSTALNLYRDTSNNRRVQFGTQFTF